MNIKISSLIFLFIFSSCQSQKGPSDVLKSFLEYRFSSSQTRDGVLEFVTGEFEERVSSMSDQELKLFLDSSKIVKKKLKIKVKKCSEEECFLTYILTYKQDGNDKEKYVIDVKKIAELKRINDDWKISNVSNVKSYIESKKGLDIKL